MHQAAVLMLFNGRDELSYGEVRDAVGLPDDELRRTLQSLALGKARPASCCRTRPWPLPASLSVTRSVRVAAVHNAGAPRVCAAAPPPSTQRCCSGCLHLSKKHQTVSCI